MLIDAGADVMAHDGDGRTPLYLAAFTDSLAIVELLLARGVDVTAVDRGDRTPLMCARFSQADDVAAILISHGARTDEGK